MRRVNYTKNTRWPRGVGSARTRGLKARSSPEDIPEWYRNLTELAQDDDELAELLLASRGDPSRLEKQLRAEMDQLHSRIVGTDGLTGSSGEDMPPTVSFQTADPFEQVRVKKLASLTLRCPPYSSDTLTLRAPRGPYE